MLKTFLYVVVGACLLASPAFAATHARAVECPANQYDPNLTAEQADACAAEASKAAQPKPPAIPTKNSKRLATAAFTGDYSKVWTYLSPAYQDAVSHSKWLSCQKKNPVAPPGLKINKVTISDYGNIPMKLAKFGTKTVYQVQLQVLFTREGARSADVVFTYWLKNKGKWGAVWLPDVYSKYKSGGCVAAGPARGLY